MVNKAVVVLIILLAANLAFFAFYLKPDQSITGDVVLENYVLSNQQGEVVQEIIEELEIEELEENPTGDDDDDDNDPYEEIITEPEIEQEELFLVTYVVDGDTIEIEGGERVRLICIDTPEIGVGGSDEATEYLEALVLGKKVRLEIDISGMDVHDRLLRYVYLEDDTFVNELIVREGLGFAYPYSPDTKHCGIIEDAEEVAKANSLGIWAAELEQEDDSEEICGSDIYNCGDFESHDEAQAVFEGCGGVGNDVHRLDRDEDGVACESLV